MIRTVVVVLASSAYLFLIFTPWFLWALVTGTTEGLYRCGVRGCRMAVRLAGIRLEVRGRENIPSDRAVVFMANHQSFCDPPAVLGVLPPVLVMLKASLFRIPVLGRAMRRHGFVPVEREHRAQAAKAVEKAVEKLQTSHSFLVYPEGTRSRDGRLLPFKRGAFVMALRAGAPIVPVSVSGAYRIMPRGDIWLHPGPVQITFHPPVETKGASTKEREAIIERVRGAVASGLSESELPLSPPEAGGC